LSQQRKADIQRDSDVFRRERRPKSRCKPLINQAFSSTNHVFYQKCTIGGRIFLIKNALLERLASQYRRHIAKPSTSPSSNKLSARSAD
jgi:hypothetical protein